MFTTHLFKNVHIKTPLKFRYLRYYTWVKHRVKMEVHYTQWWGKHYYYITDCYYPGRKYTFVKLTIDGKIGYMHLPNTIYTAKKWIDMVVYCMRNREYMRGGTIPEYGEKTVPVRTEEELDYFFDKLVYMKKRFKMK